MCNLSLSEHPDALQLMETLRKVRREADITQQALADKLGLCRETVVAIEKMKKGSIENITLQTLKGWWATCREECSPESGDRFKLLVLNIIGI